MDRENIEDYLCDYLEGNLRPKDVRAVKKAVEASEDTARTLREYERVGELYAKLPKRSAPAGFAEGVLSRMGPHLDAFSSKSKRRKRFGFLPSFEMPRLAWAYSLVAALVVIMGGLLVFGPDKETGTTPADRLVAMAPEESPADLFEMADQNQKAKEAAPPAPAKSISELVQSAVDEHKKGTLKQRDLAMEGVVGKTEAPATIPQLMDKMTLRMPAGEQMPRMQEEVFFRPEEETDEPSYRQGTSQQAPGAQAFGGLGGFGGGGLSAGDLIESRARTQPAPMSLETGAASAAQIKEDILNRLRETGGLARDIIANLPDAYFREDVEFGRERRAGAAGQFQRAEYDDDSRLTRDIQTKTPARVPILDPASGIRVTVSWKGGMTMVSRGEYTISGSGDKYTAKSTVRYNTGDGLVRSGNIPQSEVQKILDLLNRKGFWEMEDDRTVQMMDGVTFTISVSQGDRSHKCNVYMPAMTQSRAYNEIINAIRSNVSKYAKSI